MLPLILFLTALNGLAQKTVVFPSSDRLPITADLYTDQETDPYMVLFHQDNSSRGEYRETAPKMMKFGYNCLAVDLRLGKEENFVINETYQKALESFLPTDYLSILKDINAAIDYAYNLSPQHKPVILVGSSYSASLCLIAARNNPKVKAVIAFSPGEYFGSNLSVRKNLVDLEKPVLVMGCSEESTYWKELFANAGLHNFTFFVPEKKKGLRGSQSLWKTCEAKTEYWIEMMMFIRKLN